MKKIIAGCALIIAAILPGLSQAQVGVGLSITVAPPALPVYAQPPIPGDGYIWTPGYWSWNANDNDYYWVPGTWVLAPYTGALWTPGYWGWVGGFYGWHHGYWGPHIGYYGGINYGFGYTGVGYQGGYWNHGAFVYNRSVNNVVNINSAHIYNSHVVVATNNHVSYNGGHGGVQMEASKSEQMIASMPHQQRTEPQMNHETAAQTYQTQRASVNHGMPTVAATPEPGKYSSPNVVAAKPAPQQHSQPHQSPPHSGGGSHGSHHR
jgi:WXXGXW repeat (2 copies)